MFEKITLKNFQKHKHLEIDFDERITTIIGPSDSGKSAIIRSLRLVCLNRPSGDSFRRRGSKNTRIDLSVDGYSVIRSKGEGGNLFEFVNDEQNIYKSFGNSVPAPIETFLNLGDLNFQNQHDPPFWLSKSPGEVSRELNAIINLGLIDLSLSNIASEVRKTKTEMEFIEERLKEAEERKEKLLWVKEADKALQKVETKYDEWQETRLKRSRLNDLLTKAKSCDHTLESLPAAFTEAKNVLQLGQRIKETADQRAKLEKLLNKWSEYDQKRSENTIRLKSIEDEIHKQTKGRCPLCQKP